MKVRRRADVGNVITTVEMVVKNDAEERLARVTEEPATSMEVKLLSNLSRGLVPKQIASVLVGFRTRPLWRNQL